MSDTPRRCAWCGDDPLYVRYHDEEWGRPLRDDTRLFEKICLEGFQAGLSWLTILRKRENFRRAFAGFEIDAVSRFDEKDVSRLLQDVGIIRHRGKIESAINNAGRARMIQKEFGSLSTYIWSWTPEISERPFVYDRATLKMLAETPTSRAISKDLKGRGWSFVGPVTIYAFMQAVGMVNDHEHGCFRRDEIDRLKASPALP